jgi:hypothetical protein
MRTVALTITVVAALGLTTHADAATTYKVTLLHPVGYFASGIEGAFADTQVGIGSMGDFDVGFHARALLWNGTSDGVVDLHPAQFQETVAYGASGNSQVGYGFLSNGTRALLWHGSANSVVNLHPRGFTDSWAIAIDGTSQVGWADAGNFTRRHAVLWRGTADSAVDLHPQGFTNSHANDLYGDTQVGSGLGTATGGFAHALLWHGTASSVIDLHPVGFENSDVSAAWGSTQVGVGYNGEPYSLDLHQHALLWRGTAESVVDLHPAGYRESFAEDVVGDIQVGSGVIGGGGAPGPRALLWRGTADSVVDLHPFTEQLALPIFGSVARAVNENGEIFGEIVGNGDFLTYAVKWTPVPEPATLVSLCIAAIGIGTASRGPTRRAVSRKLPALARQDRVSEKLGYVMIRR